MKDKKKVNARKAAQRAVPLDHCEDCGTREGKLERHHEDYDKPTEVRVLCPPCHAKADQAAGFQPKRKPRVCPSCKEEFQPKRSRQTLCGKAECLRLHGQRAASSRWGTQ